MRYYIIWSFGDTPTEWGDFSYIYIYGYPIAECMRALQAFYFADYPVDDIIPSFQRRSIAGFEDISEEYFYYNTDYYYWVDTSGLDNYYITYREILYLQDRIEDLANSGRFTYWAWYYNTEYYYFLDTIEGITEGSGGSSDIDKYTFFSVEDMLNHALGYGSWISGNYYVYDRGIEQIRKCLESIGGFRLAFESETSNDYEADGEFYYLKVYGWYNYNNQYFDYYKALEYTNTMSFYVHYGEYSEGNVYWYNADEPLPISAYGCYGEESELAEYWYNADEPLPISAYGCYGEESELAEYWYNADEPLSISAVGTYGTDNNAFEVVYDKNESADINAPSKWTSSSDSDWSLT